MSVEGLPYQLRSFLRDVSPAPITQLVRKVLIWKRNAAFRPYVCMKHIRGESFQFYTGDSTAKSWYEGDHHEWMLEIPFILDHMLSPHGHLLQSGRPSRFPSHSMARRVSRSIAIEPNPHNVVTPPNGRCETSFSPATDYLEYQVPRITEN